MRSPLWQKRPCAQNYDARRPAGEDDRLIVRQGRHPVVERTLQDGRFMPNDTYFDENERDPHPDWPERGRRVHCHSAGGADHAHGTDRQFRASTAEAHIGLVDRIFTRIGAQ